MATYRVVAEVTISLLADSFAGGNPLHAGWAEALNEIPLPPLPKALERRRALPWWRRLFASRPVPPDREVLFWSAEGSARNTGSLWKWKAQQLLNACVEDDGEVFVDVHTWSVLTDWARAWDGES
jgi:hypothetical protein